MLKIISCNLNGIRSANKKGFFDWLHKQKADIVCLQELRASSQQINEEKINFRNNIFYIKSAEKKGYSGVGIITKHKPKKVIYSYGDTEFDNEGRYIQLNFENFIVVSLYAPSGSSSEERQKAKFRFKNKNIFCINGSAELMSLPNNCIDLITLSFGLRNFSDIEASIKECYRVLKYGGKIYCLEFSLSYSKSIKPSYDFYSNKIIPKIGKLVAKNENAYQYLTDSIHNFYHNPELKNIFNKNGFFCL